MDVHEMVGVVPSNIDGFEIGWRDTEGEHRFPLADAASSVMFEAGLPVRGFPSHRGPRHFPGLYWSATTGGHVGFESWLERDHAILLDFTPQVTGLLSQPLWLSGRTSGASGSRTLRTTSLGSRTGGVWWWTAGRGGTSL
ncbi:hypothetical protein [Streptomyces sp. NPDC002088]|uniref:hypothetical protein n=1 Tax=Streptomyces sp. NPDC002088 TaxID=3154665 RepID=UPI00331DD803